LQNTTVDDFETNPILKNAKRLLDDAELLLEHGRYASSKALAIHSFEEVGKYFLDQWEKETGSPLRDKKRNFHHEKQYVLVALYQAEVVHKSIVKTLDRSGFELKHINEASQYQRERQIRVTRISEIDKDAIENMRKALSEDKSFRLSSYAVNGLFEKMKQICTYYDKEWSNLNFSPFLIEKKHAEEDIKHAKYALSSTCDPLRTVIAKVFFMERFDRHEEAVNARKPKTRKT
jgi:AbiV family abortive infection protein